MVKISIIVAAERSGPTLGACVSALSAQLSPLDGEILVAEGFGAAADGLDCDSPSVRFISQPPGSGVPQLWQAGIEAAQGRIIALTIAECVPAQDWVRQVIQAHSAEWPAIGGAIAMHPDLNLVNAAVYFSRYSSYIPPVVATCTDDLAGDNCSYKREALEGMEAVTAEGFWETFVHRAMRARGQHLRLEPAISVSFVGSFSWWGFLTRRFAHGRYFAARQARSWPLARRCLRGAAAALVPWILLRRIAARVWRNGHHRYRFLLALPFLIAFLVAWAAGEGLGYWFGAAPVRPVSQPSTKAVGAA